MKASRVVKVSFILGDWDWEIWRGVKNEELRIDGEG